MLDVGEKIQDLVVGVDLDRLDFFAIETERFWRFDHQIGVPWGYWGHLWAAWWCGRLLDVSSLRVLSFWVRWSLLVLWWRTESHGGSNVLQQFLAKAQSAVFCALKLHDPVVDRFVELDESLLLLEQPLFGEDQAFALEIANHTSM